MAQVDIGCRWIKSKFHYEGYACILRSLQFFPQLVDTDDFISAFPDNFDLFLN
jgi:hypothetical protein